MHIIAVYGTLKKAYGNHRLIEHEAFLREDWVEFAHIKGTGFPIVQFESGTHKWLKVEVYEITDSTLQRCDNLEGHPTWYKRIPVVTKGGVECEIYHQEVDGIHDTSEDFIVSTDEDGNRYYSWERA